MHGMLPLQRRAVIASFVPLIGLVVVGCGSSNPDAPFVQPQRILTVQRKQLTLTVNISLGCAIKDWTILVSEGSQQVGLLVLTTPYNCSRGDETGHSYSKDIVLKSPIGTRTVLDQACQYFTPTCESIID